jgi:hypothetical protein
MEGYGETERDENRLGMFPLNSVNCDEGTRYAMGQQLTIFNFPTEYILVF